jgi:hypothetical protein
MTRHVFALARALLAGPSFAVVPAQESAATSSDSQTSAGFELTGRILFVDGEHVVLVDRPRGTVTHSAHYKSILSLFEDNVRRPHNGKGT